MILYCGGAGRADEVARATETRFWRLFTSQLSRLCHWPLQLRQIDWQIQFRSKQWHVLQWILSHRLAMSEWTDTKLWQNFFKIMDSDYIVGIL